MTSKFAKAIRCAKLIGKYLCFYPVVSPRETWHFLQTIGDAILRFDSTQRLSRASGCKEIIKSITLLDLFPEIENQFLNIMPRNEHDDGGMLLHELVVLCAICKYLQPKRVFEFGTFKGNSTLHLALNSPDGCEIFTIDLPPRSRKCTRYLIEIGPITGEPFTVGELYHGSTIEFKIKQLYGDSADFDYSQFQHCMDLVFVDGNHQYDNVKSDSENAFNMLSAQGKVIWHDHTNLPEHAGVVKYLNELSNCMQLFKIAGTCLVIAWPGGKVDHDH